ncbi:hypothetical protein [Pedobacter sp. BMA]|uniref:hypothetical protein n=1 Tax=Pedobacter sp. BMA TaxID=1663685 RepID=UPI00064A44C0|nr:hypothetical protein [Pedobacter sp. BMA]KLT64227.1 hypothetical protein AB669_16815 [Pedobacter sp. BMA]
MMKHILYTLLLILSGTIANAQQRKISIDYQYFRDVKNYYAYDLFRYSGSPDNQVMLNFTTNAAFKKIEKIYIVAGDVEIKLKFRQRDEVVKSDNPEQKFYPVAFDIDNLLENKLDCQSRIVFKLDNNISYTLPFNGCNALLTKPKS